MLRAGAVETELDPATRKQRKLPVDVNGTKMEVIDIAKRGVELNPEVNWTWLRLADEIGSKNWTPQQRVKTPLQEAQDDLANRNKGQPSTFLVDAAPFALPSFLSTEYAYTKALCVSNCNSSGVTMGSLWRDWLERHSTDYPTDLPLEIAAAQSFSPTRKLEPIMSFLIDVVSKPNGLIRSAMIFLQEIELPEDRIPSLLDVFDRVYDYGEWFPDARRQVIIAYSLRADHYPALIARRPLVVNNLASWIRSKMFSYHGVMILEDFMFAENPDLYHSMHRIGAIQALFQGLKEDDHRRTPKAMDGMITSAFTTMELCPVVNALCRGVVEQVLAVYDVFNWMLDKATEPESQTRKWSFRVRGQIVSPAVAIIFNLYRLVVKWKSYLIPKEQFVVIRNYIAASDLLQSALAEPEQHVAGALATVVRLLAGEV